jgi:hypothetical protein
MGRLGLAGVDSNSQPAETLLLKFGIEVRVLNQEPGGQGALFTDQAAVRPTHPVQHGANPGSVLDVDLDQPIDRLPRGMPLRRSPGSVVASHPVCQLGRQHVVHVSIVDHRRRRSYECLP